MIKFSNKAKTFILIIHFYFYKINLRYFIRVTITKKLILTKSFSENIFYVYNPSLSASRLNASLNIEMGIQEKLNLNFEIFQNKFHLHDCIIGKLIFNKVKIPIKSVEVHLYKKEILLGKTNSRNYIFCEISI